MSTVFEHGVGAAPLDQPATARRVPLVTVPTASGESARICCELHTPWTQLLSSTERSTSSTRAAQHSGFGGPGRGVGNGVAALAATEQPTGNSGGGLSPSAPAAGAISQPHDPAGAAQAAGSAGGSSNAPEPQDSGQREPQQQQQHQGARVNDPRRQKLLIVASLGVEGGSGWFSHVAAHLASLVDPATGQPAADVVTFDNRRRWSTVAGKPPPRQGASGYSSEAMAADAVALMDALGWRRAHLVGMSLGAMVAAKAAALAPQRVASLTLLGYTLNGWQMAASLVTRPHRLLPVILGTERSRIRATLPFYFTRRFLDAPLTQRQRSASEQWRAGGGVAAGQDIETGNGTQHGSAASTCSTEGGDVPVQGNRLQQALLGRRQQQQPGDEPAAPVMTREDAILGNQALASAGGGAAAARSAPAAGGGSSAAAAAAGPSRASGPARSFAQAADAALGEAGLAGPAAAGASAGAASDDPAALPDTGLRSHSLACLLHWLTHAEARAIADAAFPTTLLGGRHDPVAPVKWLQLAAARLRGTLIVTEASHAGLTVESCCEVLATLELNVFGRTLADRATWTAVQEAAIDDAVTKPHLIKR